MIRWTLVTILSLLALVTAVGWVISLDGEPRWAHVSPDGLAVGLLPFRDAHTHIVLSDGRVGITHRTPVPPTSNIPYRSFEFCGLFLRAEPSQRPWTVLSLDPDFDREAYYLKHRKLERYVGFPLWMPLVLFSLYPLIVFAHGPLRRLARRRTGRCQECGYNLTGNVTGRCPECGTAVKRGDEPA